MGQTAGFRSFFWFPPTLKTARVAFHFYFETDSRLGIKTNGLGVRRQFEGKYLLFEKSFCTIFSFLCVKSSNCTCLLDYKRASDHIDTSHFVL